MTGDVLAIPRVLGLGHVTFGVVDLAASIAFATRFGKLAVAERRAGEAFLAGGATHYWLRLQTAERPGIVRLGLEAVDEDALDDIAARLDGLGVAWTRDDHAMERDRVARWLRFRDPDGIEVEVFAGMMSRHVPGPDRVELESLVHAVSFVADARASSAFYVDVLGLRESDWIEQSHVFLRAANDFHHCIGLFEDPERQGMLAHHCVQCATFDDLMIVRRDALDSEVGVARDLMSHHLSDSISIYLADPTTGLQFEFCIGHEIVTPSDRPPRVYPRTQHLVDRWSVPMEPFAEDGD